MLIGYTDLGDKLAAWESYRVESLCLVDALAWCRG